MRPQKVTDQELIDIVKAEIVDAMKRYGSDNYDYEMSCVKLGDRAALKNCGARTRSISFEVSLSRPRLLLRLTALAKQGLLLAHSPRSGMSIQWWPVGFAEELVSIDAMKGMVK